MGDVNGVGPEIFAKALAMKDLCRSARMVIFGDLNAYESCRRFAVGTSDPSPVDSVEEAVRVEEEKVPVLDFGWKAPVRRPGILDPEAGRCAVEWVRAAAQLALKGSVDAIVTGPLNKEAIHQAGYGYAGHTELIAETTGTRDYRMGLFSLNMRVVHNSTHCSLREAIQLARKDRILTTLRIAAQSLDRLGIENGRIAVCGLNPHAGEGGAFGTEEIDEILPAIEAANQEGLCCSGPYPADTIFNRMRSGDFEMVIAMYHDQGHGPMKLVAMDESVNVTLGIPIVRTSVDHGTAFDIAGTGKARPDSLVQAIQLAVHFTRKD
jgi:4-hydroxythreonine-4-phosphate dehydrogenase